MAAVTLHSSSGSMWCRLLSSPACRGLRRLGAAGPAALSLGGPAALGATSKLHTSAACGATRADVLSSGKAPSDAPPDDPQQFGRFADLYIGDIWSKIEAGLRKEEGESFDFNVEMQGGRLRFTLPDGAEFSICKDPAHAALVVESNMQDTYGSHDKHTEVAFRLKDGGFEADGESLHAYLEDGLAKHLKIQVDLEPELDKIYGPDPT